MSIHRVRVFAARALTLIDAVAVAIPAAAYAERFAIQGLQLLLLILVPSGVVSLGAASPGGRRALTGTSDGLTRGRPSLELGLLMSLSHFMTGAAWLATAVIARASAPFVQLSGLYVVGVMLLLVFPPPPWRGRALVVAKPSAVVTVVAVVWLGGLLAQAPGAPLAAGSPALVFAAWSLALMAYVCCAVITVAHAGDEDEPQGLERWDTGYVIVIVVHAAGLLTWFVVDERVQLALGLG